MKNQLFSLRYLLGSLLVVTLFMGLFQACSKSDNSTPAPTVDKTKLKARLDSANAVYGAASEGSAVGKYQAGSKATYQAAITAATAVYNDPNATQTSVNNAYVNLGMANTTFASAQVQEIAPQSLVLFFKFDGAQVTGGKVTDLSGKNNNGTMMAGTFWGGGMPTVTADRFGTASQALLFNKGSNVEIPYSPTLNPAKEITISLWERLDSSWSNNYMVALNRWNGYKLQLQDGNKAFFSVKTNNANTIWDRDDASVQLDLKKWHHVAVTYKSGEMDFYIDGTLIKAWTDVSGDPAAVKSSINMTIGQDLPNSLYDKVNMKDNADGNNFYQPYGGYFVGALDDIRVYNAFLSAAQIGSIYAAEKSQ